MSVTTEQLQQFIRTNVSLIVGIIGVLYVMYDFFKTGVLNTALLTTFGGLAGFQSFLGARPPPEEGSKT